MDFAPSWDRHLLRFWAETNNEYGVLTTYVADKRELGKCLNGHFEVPHLCQVEWGAGGVPRNSQAKAARNLEAPVLTSLWAAGLSFARCHFEKRVPNDPSLPYIFDGEEFSRGLRAWTWGYDFYTPPRTVVGHAYNRPRKGQWSMVDGSDGPALASRRLKLLLGLAPPAQPHRQPAAAADVGARVVDAERRSVQGSRYGLGPRRTAAQYRAFSRVDLAHSSARVARVQGSCLARDFMPWKEPPPTVSTVPALGGSKTTEASEDVFWASDSLSWPPPLEGSLAHLDWAHDPANPKGAGSWLEAPEPFGADDVNGGGVGSGIGGRGGLVGGPGVSSDLGVRGGGVELGRRRSERPPPDGSLVGEAAARGGGGQWPGGVGGDEGRNGRDAGGVEEESPLLAKGLWMAALALGLNALYALWLAFPMTPLCRLCRRPPDLPEALHGLTAGTAFPVGLGGEAPCPCLCWDTRHDRPESALDRYYAHAGYKGAIKVV